jgi:hypothetical protein
MAESNTATTSAEPTEDTDLEKADHAVLPINNVENNPGTEEQRSSSEENTPATDQTEAKVPSDFDLFDESDPFALFPTLSLSKSSTQGPWMRRNTTISLGRALTREQTRETLKTVRSRFTEVRDEFDENVSHAHLSCY